MDPTVVAAWIAAGVSALTLVGTLAAQYLGYRSSSRDAERTAGDQRQQLDRTFAEQNQQLDRTLAEQRRHLDRTLAEQNQQLDRTLAEQRARTLNERFATAAEQLGSDKPAVRLSGVYAMAGLADDWEENRRTCVDVLCAYLRMPYRPDPGPDAPQSERLDFQANREVRHTVIRVITAHLRNGAATSWQDCLVFDFNGVAFDGGDFMGAEFSGGRVDFSGAEFRSGTVHFNFATFSGCLVDFRGAVFSGGTVDFSFAKFTGGAVDFSYARFSGGAVDFSYARFFDGKIEFKDAEFCGGTLDLSQAHEWSLMPTFPWTDAPPPGLKLPSDD
jgi:uncharacterized protein YjbI with pentapeptide repeats